MPSLRLLHTNDNPNPNPNPAPSPRSYLHLTISGEASSPRLTCCPAERKQMTAIPPCSRFLLRPAEEKKNAGELISPEEELSPSRFPYAIKPPKQQHLCVLAASEQHQHSPFSVPVATGEKIATTVGFLLHYLPPPSSSIVIQRLGTPRTAGRDI